MRRRNHFPLAYVIFQVGFSDLRIYLGAMPVKFVSRPLCQSPFLGCEDEIYFPLGWVISQVFTLTV